MHTFHCMQPLILVGGNLEGFPELRLICYSEHQSNNIFLWSEYADKVLNIDSNVILFC